MTFTDDLTPLNIATTARWQDCQHVYTDKIVWRQPPSGGQDVPMPVCDGCAVPLPVPNANRWKIRDWRDAA